MTASSADLPCPPHQKTNAYINSTTTADQQPTHPKVNNHVNAPIATMTTDSSIDFAVFSSCTIVHFIEPHSVTLWLQRHQLQINHLKKPSSPHSQRHPLPTHQNKPATEAQTNSQVTKRATHKSPKHKPTQFQSWEWMVNSKDDKGAESEEYKNKHLHQPNPHKVKNTQISSNKRQQTKQPLRRKNQLLNQLNPQKQPNPQVTLKAPNHNRNFKVESGSEEARVSEG